MISTRGLISRLTIRLELYINLIVVPLPVLRTHRRQSEWDKLFTHHRLHHLASLATLLACPTDLEALGETTAFQGENGDHAAVKLMLLSYPPPEHHHRAAMFLVLTSCMRSCSCGWPDVFSPPYSSSSSVCAHNSVISYCTTDHLLAPVLMVNG
jgi:hypothetical protein